jgi:predicted PurR-regulated permease PerM
VLAGQAIRGVALGVVVTALVQSGLGGIGLAIAGVPFAGVIGGLIAFGIVGIFVGPVVLAVAYTLLDNWVSAEPPAGAGPPS